MSRYTCGYCLFAEETEDRSSDEIDCFFKKMGRRKINDYPCAKWKQGKGGLEDEREEFRQKGEHLKSIAGKCKEKSPKDLRKTKMLSCGLKAMAYIFDDTWQSENYVFGFKFICKHIGLDPGKFRTAIRRLRQQHIAGVWDRARGREEQNDRH